MNHKNCMLTSLHIVQCIFHELHVIISMPEVQMFLYCIFIPNANDSSYETCQGLHL